MNAASRLGRWVTEHVVLFLAALVLLYMFLPVFFVLLMSFNDPESRLAYTFDGFTLANWTNPCAAAGMCDSLVVSFQIGLLATLGATALAMVVVAMLSMACSTSPGFADGFSSRYNATVPATCGEAIEVPLFAT